MKVNVLSKKSQQTRQKILLSASRLFLSGGIRALSVRAIAAKAGVSTIGIYNYFNGKQGILDALYVEGFELVYQATGEAKAKPSREDILKSVAAYLRVAQDHEAHYRLIFGEVDASYEPSKDALIARERAFNRLVNSVGAYLPESANLKEKRDLALDLWSLVHGYVSLAHHGLRDNSAPKRWRQGVLRAIGVYLDGVDG